MTASLPTFIIIGAQKSATRWLRDVLGQHPDVFTAPRELEFFNHHYAKGLRWYANQFTPAGPAKAIGEATPGYMMWTDDPARSAARIDGCLPDVKLLALLRNPVDRLSSAFIHHVRMGRLDPTRGLADHVIDVDPEEDEMGLVSGSWYARSLTPYLDRFGDRLMILLQEDIQDDPGTLYAQVAAHIGVSPRFKPTGLGEVRHSNRASINEDVLVKAAPTPNERAELMERFFADDVAELADRTGLDLSRWRT